MYGNFIEQISKEALRSFDTILATHNFENGPEFEIALCKILQLLLPKKYKVCRGYVVAATNEKAGDDIIIYDQGAFPKIRIIEDDLAVKQYIPIEAVYAYIEAKHTLWLDGKNENLTKACDQIVKVKSLTRPSLSFESLNGYNIKAEGNIKITVSGRKNWPNCQNPLFTCIMSRDVKKAPKQPITLEDFEGSLNLIPEMSQKKVDLIVAGDQFIGIPCISNVIVSPFLLETDSQRALFETPNSFGVGFSILMWALANIKLGNIDYSQMIGSALGLSMNNGG